MLQQTVSTYTVDYIKQKLATDQKWLERAIVVLFKRQTNDEQRAETTKFTNGVGFTAFDAKRLSYYAKWINAGRNLSGIHLQKARTIVPKYSKQIQDEIMSRHS